jgi:hypothetical protein
MKLGRLPPHGGCMRACGADVRELLHDVDDAALCTLIRSASGRVEAAADAALLARVADGNRDA